MDLYKSHKGIHAEHNDNILPLVYTLEIEINLLDFNPSYPKNPRTLGEKLRKARMDKGMLIREFATQIGVNEDTVINWELRRVKPRRKALKGLKRILEI